MRNTSQAIRLPLLAAAFLLAGCASDPAPGLVTAFSDSDFHYWQGPGAANLAGQAFYRLPSGRVVTCAGESVTLIPATGYNMELEQALGAGKGYPENYDRKAHTYNRTTLCDGAGHFSFEKVPTQNWIVLTRVVWQEPSSIPYMSSDAAGYLYQEIKLAEGDNKLILSNLDFVKDDN